MLGGAGGQGTGGGKHKAALVEGEQAEAGRASTPASRHPSPHPSPARSDRPPPNVPPPNPDPSRPFVTVKSATVPSPTRPPHSPALPRPPAPDTPQRPCGATSCAFYLPHLVPFVFCSVAYLRLAMFPQPFLVAIPYSPRPRTFFCSRRRPGGARAPLPPYCPPRARWARLHLLHVPACQPPPARPRAPPSPALLPNPAGFRARCLGFLSGLQPLPIPITNLYPCFFSWHILYPASILGLC